MVSPAFSGEIFRRDGVEERMQRDARIRDVLDGEMVPVGALGGAEGGKVAREEGRWRGHPFLFPSSSAFSNELNSLQAPARETRYLLHSRLALDAVARRAGRSGRGEEVVRAVQLCSSFPLLRVPSLLDASISFACSAHGLISPSKRSSSLLSSRLCAPLVAIRKADLRSSTSPPSFPSSLIHTSFSICP